MFWLSSSGSAPDLGRLAACFCFVGVLGAVPALTWLAMYLLGAKLFTPAATDTQIWIFIFVWQVGNILWWIPTHMVDNWQRERVRRRQATTRHACDDLNHPSEPGSSSSC